MNILISILVSNFENSKIRIFDRSIKQERWHECVRRKVESIAWEDMGERGLYSNERSSKVITRRKEQDVEA